MQERPFTRWKHSNGTAGLLLAAQDEERGSVVEVLSDIVRKDPRTSVQAALWRYDEMRPFITEAGRIIPPKKQNAAC